MPIRFPGTVWTYCSASSANELTEISNRLDQHWKEKVLPAKRFESYLKAQQWRYPGTSCPLPDPEDRVLQRQCIFLPKSENHNSFHTYLSSMPHLFLICCCISVLFSSSVSLVPHFSTTSPTSYHPSAAQYISALPLSTRKVSSSLDFVLFTSKLGKLCVYIA